MKSRNPWKLPLRQFPRESTERHGAQQTRMGQSLSSPDSKCKQPVCHQAAPSPPRSDCVSCCDGDETAIHLQQLLIKRFRRWTNGLEYTAPSEDRLCPRKRFRTSQWESDLLRIEDEDVSHEGLAVVSHSACNT
ncbi:hypothetical protein HZ326_31019 [Fusarium oxysporum f. sp. albedinis]|nr:hypothetical protein HZ326_31019 [Fusarium oxysporum f. sp. albedinis]